MNLKHIMQFSRKNISSVTMRQAVFLLNIMRILGLNQSYPEYKRKRLLSMVPRVAYKAIVCSCPKSKLERGSQPLREDVTCPLKYWICSIFKKESRNEGKLASLASTNKKSLRKECTLTPTEIMKSIHRNRIQTNQVRLPVRMLMMSGCERFV